MTAKNSANFPNAVLMPRTKGKYGANISRQFYQNSYGLKKNSFLIFLGLCVVGVLAYMDYDVTYRFSFTIFYLAPILLAEKYLGKKSAIIIAIVATLLSLFADLLSDLHYGLQIVPYWNALMRAMLFGVIIFFMSAITSKP